MVDRKVADGVALGVFFVVLIGGLFLVAEKGPEFERPETRTRVIETSRGNGPAKKTTSKERTRKVPKAKSASATYTVERSVGKPAHKTSLTIEHGSRSLWERGLGESGLIALQAALVVLASFLFAGLIQRVLLGEYAVKFGNFELGALQEGKEATQKLTAHLADLEDRYTQLKVATEEQKQQLDELNASIELDQRDSAAVARILKEHDERLQAVGG
ncbi:MAG: hypothetical protein ACTHN3_09720 [Solirubrobacterales bacterium]